MTKVRYLKLVKDKVGYLELTKDKCAIPGGSERQICDTWRKCVSSRTLEPAARSKVSPGVPGKMLGRKKPDKMEYWSNVMAV